MTGVLSQSGPFSRLGLPPLRGTLSTRDSDLAAAARDFGNRIHLRPVAVLRPADAEDVATIVRFGRENGFAVVPRGAACSVDGQAQTSDGIVVDLSSLSAVGEPAPGLVRVDGGARWQGVLDATLPCGRVPLVVPDHLGLSVGGTLSVGGIGGTSHRYGSVADNVLELEVVTASGDLLTCSPVRRPELFDAVRGSLGRYGIITGATLALTGARSSARAYRLVYHDCAAFLADQQRLVHEGRFEHVEGHAHRSGTSGWVFVLEAMQSFDTPHEPDDTALLEGLTHHHVDTIETVSYRDFLGRVAPLEARLRALGSWQHHPHPRCNVLLPGLEAEALITRTLAGLTEEDIGPGGSVLLYPIPTARLAAPHVPKARDALTVVFGLQRTAPPDQPELLDRMVRDNLALRAAARKAGGADYAYAATHCEAPDAYESFGRTPQSR
ncbi:FAD-binding protein [Streptomyces sp. SCL15-6]|uniref:FAD-binding protein n=1 Tax=Streptomyces sp. SCL15-6 TaxID=2967222 RepID=UPI0029665D07|nr:FAD-binding protein [Streptomyces sp. SCL15-6]